MATCMTTRILHSDPGPLNSYWTAIRLCPPSARMTPCAAPSPRCSLLMTCGRHSQCCPPAFAALSSQAFPRSEHGPFIMHGCTYVNPSTFHLRLMLHMPHTKTSAHDDS